MTRTPRRRRARPPASPGCTVTGRAAAAALVTHTGPALSDRRRTVPVTPTARVRDSDRDSHGPAVALSHRSNSDALASLSDSDDSDPVTPAWSVSVRVTVGPSAARRPGGPGPGPRAGCHGLPWHVPPRPATATTAPAWNY